MYGFIGHFSIYRNNNARLFAKKHNNIQVIEKSLHNDYIQIKQCTPKKFENDKLFWESETIVLVIEGVIYNYDTLKDHSGCDDRGRMIEIIYLREGIAGVLNLVRGLFSGVLFSKKEKKLFLFTDISSHKPIWYYQSTDELYFSTDIHWLYSTLTQNNKKLTLNVDGAFCLLNFGYMLGDISLVSGLKKVLPGHYIEINNENIASIEYYRIGTDMQKENLESLSRDALMLNVKEAFEKAVRRVLDKDNEYGYKHLMTLSAGLDSRLLFFAAKEMGYSMTCITMGESDCEDIKVSTQICNDYKQQHIIIQLNNGLCLLNIDDAVEANGGNIQWPGFAQCNMMDQLINISEEYGAVHSGDCAGFILGGAFMNDVENEQISMNMGIYATSFIDGFTSAFVDTELNRYNDAYSFILYNRGFNANSNGGFAAHRYTECSQAFLDRDFIEVASRIPRDYLSHHRFYFDFIKSCYPEACNYIWDHTGCKPDAGRLERAIVLNKRRIQHHIFGRSFSLNPLEKWYVENKAVSEYYHDIIENGIGAMECNSKLADAVSVRANGSVMDKSLACTLLQTIKKYDIEVPD